MDPLQIASLGVSIIALILATWTALRQVRVARGGSNLAFTTELLKEYRTVEAAESRRYVFKTLEKFSPNHGYQNLPDEARTHVYRVSTLCDHIAFCVAHDLVDEELVAGFAGDSIAHLWAVLEPYVRQERELRGAAGQKAEYQEYFQDLASRLRERVPSEARRHLKR